MVSAERWLSTSGAVAMCPPKPKGRHRVQHRPRQVGRETNFLLVARGMMVGGVGPSIAKVTLQITRPREIVPPRIPSGRAATCSENKRGGGAYTNICCPSGDSARLEYESIKLPRYILPRRVLVILRPLFVVGIIERLINICFEYL